MQRMVMLTEKEYELLMSDVNNMRNKVDRMIEKIEDKSLEALLYSMDILLVDMEERLTDPFEKVRKENGY